LLGRKQRVRNQDFLDTLARIEEVVPRPVAMRVFTEAVREIRDYTAGKRVAFAWSGGKDSLALQAVCYEAGVRECLFTMTDLEYPAFLAWVTDNMPDRLEVVNTGQNLEWLARHLDWLFPQNATAAGRWFKAVQHTGQEFFYRKRDLDMLLLGRRRADGNYIGGKNAKAYESRGILRYCPLADWSQNRSWRSITISGSRSHPPTAGQTVSWSARERGRPDNTRGAWRTAGVKFSPSIRL